MLQLGWEKAFDETGAELAWWRDRTVDTARELTRARSVDVTCARTASDAGEGQSKRSGCSRVIFW